MVKNLYDYLAKPDKTIGEHVEDLLYRANILRKLGYIKDIHIYNLLIKACEWHDVGKANKEFLKRVLNPKLHFDETKEIAHNILSVYYLDKNEFEEDTDDYFIVACCILFHHDYCDEASVIGEHSSQINSLLIPEYNCNPDERDLLELDCYLEMQETIIVKGLLHRCDYSASGNYEIEYPNDFLEAGLTQMMNEWQKKKKDSCWNELQEFCIENREENIIALAPTGMGKTEAGLLWIGDNKGFFILPIRTAINAIYDRIKNQILKDEKLEERLGLLHSESLSYYESHAGQEMDILDYRNRGQALSLPLNISTLDQLFDFVFKYKGYEMKLATLAYSKIVIDEIQMYDAEMLAYLIYGLRRIHELGGKIAIVTATLPPFIKKLLKDKSIGNIEFKEQDFTNDLKRHSVKVMDESICEDDIIQCYNQNIKEGKGNKILVVCNTIKKAQKMYDQIKEKDGTLNSHVLHSRFDREDRKNLENEIKEFGKTYNEQNEIDIQNGIWIATSIVEVSLDIDFDYLFTELTDLNGLFQRMGRCNRKGVKQLDGYARKFIEQYFEKGAKRGVVLPFIDEIDSMRYVHTISVFFIGLLIKRELCPNLAIRSKVDTDYEFSYLWFLVCLFHDMGYAIENDWTYKFTYKKNTNQYRNKYREKRDLPKWRQDRYEDLGVIYVAPTNDIHSHFRRGFKRNYINEFDSIIFNNGISVCKSTYRRGTVFNY